MQLTLVGRRARGKRRGPRGGVATLTVVPAGSGCQRRSAPLPATIAHKITI